MVVLLSREFAVRVLAANLLAWPVVWYVMNAWLNNFALHTGISVSYFLLAGAITFLIALFTVGFHAVKAAGASPTDSLKNE